MFPSEEELEQAKKDREDANKPIGHEYADHKNDQTKFEIAIVNQANDGLVIQAFVN